MHLSKPLFSLYLLPKQELEKVVPDHVFFGMVFAKAGTIGPVKPIGVKDSLRLYSLQGHKTKSKVNRSRIENDLENR